MGTNVLPALPGLDVEVERTTRFRNTRFQTESGKVQMVNWGSAPIYEYALTWNVLRNNVYLTTGSFSGSSEIAAINALFNSTSGSFDTFTLNDPYSGTPTTVRFLEDTLTIRQIVPGWWTASVKAESVL